MLAKVLPSGWRIVKRRCVQPSASAAGRAWLNPYHAGDAWVAWRSGTTVELTVELLFEQYTAAQIKATPMDQMSFNGLVHQVRNHRPRRRAETLLATQSRRSAG